MPVTEEEGSTDSFSAEVDSVFFLYACFNYNR